MGSAIKKVGKFIFWLLVRPKVMFFRCLSYGHVIGKLKRNQAALIVGRGSVQFKGDVTVGYSHQHIISLRMHIWRPEIKDQNLNRS